MKRKISRMSNIQASIIDHTLLKPESTEDDIKSLIEEAVELGTYSICVSPSMLPIELPRGLKLAVVCGFPSGAHSPEVKALEAKQSCDRGADEVDMVVNLANIKSQNWYAVRNDITAVREAVERPRILKVIIESSVLTEDEIVKVCEIAVECGADFVKTSTGFHPSGGASVEAVKLMSKTVGNRAGVKASGGIRDPKTASEMVEAGATRLGLSSSRKILEK